MCHNVQDGRFHPACGHFIALATRPVDCLRPNCLFSKRHPTGCKSSACIKMMGLPQRNPIRITHELRCQDCVMRGPEGIIGYT